MTRTKVSELTGEKLAELTARARVWRKLDMPQDPICGKETVWLNGDRIVCPVQGYRPDINGAQAMELAEKFGLVVNFEIGEVWKNCNVFKLGDYGDYSAICRAVVSSVYGEYVEEDE